MTWLLWARFLVQALLVSLVGSFVWILRAAGERPKAASPKTTRRA